MCTSFGLVEGFIIISSASPKLFLFIQMGRTLAEWNLFVFRLKSQILHISSYLQIIDIICVQKTCIQNVNYLSWGTYLLISPSLFVQISHYLYIWMILYFYCTFFTPLFAILTLLLNRGIQNDKHKNNLITTKFKTTPLWKRFLLWC